MVLNFIIIHLFSKGLMEIQEKVTKYLLIIFIDLVWRIQSYN